MCWRQIWADFPLFVGVGVCGGVFPFTVLYVVQLVYTKVVHPRGIPKPFLGRKWYSPGVYQSGSTRLYHYFIPGSAIYCDFNEAEVY